MYGLQYLEYLARPIQSIHQDQVDESCQFELFFGFQIKRSSLDPWPWSRAVFFGKTHHLSNSIQGAANIYCWGWGLSFPAIRLAFHLGE